MASSERSGRTGRTANSASYFSAENLFKSVFNAAFDFLLDGETSNPQGCEREQDETDFLSEGSGSFVAPRQIVIPDVFDDPHLSIISDSSDEYSTDSEDDRTIDSDESDSSTEAPSVYKKYQEDYLQEYFESQEGTSWDFENNVVRFPSHQIPQGVEGVIVNRGRGRQSRRRQPPPRSHSAMPTNRLLQKRRRQKRKMRRKNRQIEEREPQSDERLKSQEVRHRSLALSPSREKEQQQQKKKPVRSKSKTLRSNQSAPQLGRGRTARARSKSRPRDTRDSPREVDVTEKRAKSERGPREIDATERRAKSERGRSKSRHKRMSSKEAATYAELIERARSKSRTKSRTNNNNRANNNEVLRELQDVSSPKNEETSWKFRGKRNKEKVTDAEMKPKPKQNKPKRDPPAPKYEKDTDRRPPTGPRNKSKHNRTPTAGGGNSGHNKSKGGRRGSSRQSGSATREKSNSRDRALHGSSSNASSIQAVGSTESKRSRFWLFSRSRDSFSKDR